MSVLSGYLVGNVAEVFLVLVAVLSGADTSDFTKLFIEILWIGDADIGADFENGEGGGGQE